MKPGERLIRSDGTPTEWVIQAPLAYQGKKGCEHPLCSRILGEDGCRGYHCAVCGEPCSMMGHAKCASVREALADVERAAPDETNPDHGPQGAER